MVDDSAIGNQPVAQLANLGADVDGKFLVPRPRLPELRRDASSPSLPLVE